jgi:hypothetical protein
MLVQLARKPKAIAWSFFALFYVELLLTPIVAGAAVPYPITYARAGNARWASATYPAARPMEKYKDAVVTKTNHFIVKPIIPAVADKAVAAAPASADIGGPGQPEMQSFSSVNNANMVDLFTGNFSYNIPLLDVGGYPVSLGYTAGVTMDQEASWVGLGWNINPGTVTRNLRGLPDDFNGDKVKKTVNMKSNKTVGVTAGADLEIAGFPKKTPDSEKTEANATYKGGKIGTSLGITHNNYKGWGIEQGINASLNSGKVGKGTLSAGLSLTNSTTEGLSINPAITLSGGMKLKDEARGGGGLTLSLPYNSRSGLHSLQLSMGTAYDRKTTASKKEASTSGGFQSSLISFYQPSVIPSINIPYYSDQFTFTAKVGILQKVTHPSLYVIGYRTLQYIPSEDTTREIAAYGYLNYQNGAGNPGSLLDYNREKELPYREKPVYPHIAVPSYTYDAFSVSGEGTGGMFRAYRGEIGFVHDHFMKTRSSSTVGGLDIGVGDMVHWGADIGITSSDTRTGPWSNSNPVADIIKFRQKSNLYEPSYFRNPGEKAINSKKYYEALGGDDVVAVHLDQYRSNSSTTQAIAVLDRFRDKKYVGSDTLKNANAAKTDRDKRTQVISYLTAAEADAAGLNKYIENFTPNLFDPSICGKVEQPLEPVGTGLKYEVFENPDMLGDPVFVKYGEIIKKAITHDAPLGTTQIDKFSIRWTGRIKAPYTGTYNFTMRGDDGFRLKINGQTIIQDWRPRRVSDGKVSGSLNLEKGQFYEIVAELYDKKNEYGMELSWVMPHSAVPDLKGDSVDIPISVLYPPAIDSFIINSNTTPAQKIMVKEKRVNDFRKAHHISEITVLNADGRRYAYGIPVYNLLQKDVTFSVNGGNQGNMESGLIKYAQNDNSTKNMRGKDWYFTKEETPAYAHSFLLTGIVSDDYSDLTGDGISDDDPGNAVKFNYSKFSGVRNPFKWKAPFVGVDTASFNEGLRTDNRDDKASYAYGEKEMWYLHSIESKTMIATFVTETRQDMPSIDEKGNRDYSAPSRRLEKINLYNKADFAKNGTKAIPVKTVNFEYSYELCKGIKDAATGKLTLKKVWFSYNGNAQPKEKSNPYIFSYHSNNPGYNSQHSDRWANYKSPLQNPGSTVLKPVRNSEFPYAIQDSSNAAINAGAWNLDSIFLPSGGSMKIDYESDDYGFVQNKVATQMFNLAGLGSSPDFSKARPALYAPMRGNIPDYLYVFIKVPVAVTKKQDVYNLYLAGLDKLYFKTFVRVPTDNYNNGQTHEYVPCYGRINAAAGNYGVSAPDMIWVKLESVNASGEAGGNYSPLAKAATQFLRLNLPSKAYPGSETGDGLDLAEAVQMLASLGSNIANALKNFDKIARENNWVNDIDPDRSFVRLLNPHRKKLGGGHRVKRITIYDNWNKMTGQRAAKYGQEYIYTTEEEVNGKRTMISSGVAEYEPAIGGDENPFHLPIEYIDQPSVIAPMTMGYSEEPLGEAFYPAPGVGYSKIRVRSIHHQKKKSANGFDETCFYTARDFPIFTDRTMFDAATKKRYRPSISNFFRINSYHFLTLTQGFKVELNDMHGKLRSKASYPETDHKNYITYQEYFYRTESTIKGKRLSNTVMAIHPDGKIDSAALIGKDVELMVDMREQESLVISTNIPINLDAFTIGVVPFIFALPSYINAYQREKNLYRSVATVKLVHRYGILDSVLAVDKGSKITTKDILYDSETGDVVLTRTQNEFDDYVYNFNYPSHWAYPAMGPAYKNIDLYLEHMTIRDGKLMNSSPAIDSMLASGDEILVAGKQKTGGVTCNEKIASFPNSNKVWCVDSSALNGGQRSLYFIDRDGVPYTGFDISMKVVRSGRRNVFTGVGNITSIGELLKKDGSGNYQLVVDGNSKVLAAAANEFRQIWKVEDMKRMKRDTTVVYSCPPGYTYSAAVGSCVRDTSITITQNHIVFTPATNRSYSSCGSYIYSPGFNIQNTIFTRSQLPYNEFWANHHELDICVDPVPTEQLQAPSLKIMSESEKQDSLNNLALSQASPPVVVPLGPGPLNRTGIWIDPSPALDTWQGFDVPVYIPEDSTYYIGMAADNQIKVTIDGVVFREDPTKTEPHNFQLWHIFPKYLTRGVHIWIGNLSQYRG